MHLCPLLQTMYTLNRLIFLFISCTLLLQNVACIPPTYEKKNTDCILEVKILESIADIFSKKKNPQKQINLYPDNDGYILSASAPEKLLPVRVDYTGLDFFK